nr:ATP-binding protein [Shewanella insulae]
MLKNLVGKDLINDDSIAIIELVKNSIDADSSNINIQFKSSSKSGVYGESSALIISDDGCGMQEVDLRDKWLNIAFSEKNESLSESGGFYAGNKGVGRFSCDRLGKQLDMFTRSRGGEILWLEVDWVNFEIEGDKDLIIQDVPIQLSTVSEDFVKSKTGLDIADSGTILLISSLRELWGRPELLSLKKSLERFINPNQLYMREAFNIYLEAKHFEEMDRDRDYHDSVNGEVKNLIFENLKFNTTYIESAISKCGCYVETSLHHDGEKVFSLKEKNEIYKFISDIKITIYFLNSYKKAYFKRQTGIRSVDFGSMFLFVNGFRVAPYGDRGDDWLGLDVRKTQGNTRYLGSRDIIGRIEVTDFSNNFRQVSSREGLIKSVHFTELKDSFFFDVLRKLEKFIVGGLDWDSVPNSVRNELRSSDGLDWDQTSEKYEETWDKKKRRISRSIMSLIGTSKDRAVELWFNPSLLEDVAAQKEEHLEKLLSDIEGYEPNQVDRSLARSVNNLKELVRKASSEATTAKEKVFVLEDKLEQQTDTVIRLEKESESYKEQALFLKSVTSLDKSSLLSYHHQICLDSSILENYVGQVIALVQKGGSGEKILRLMEKVSKANKRILATAQYATKANFRSGTKRELTDIPSFFKEYIENVAVDFVAAGLQVKVINSVTTPFKVKVQRIELAILIDNLISNSDKANARNVNVSLELKSEDKLAVTFSDDGDGVDKKVSDINSLFNIGVTTTSGSGLGLYHVSEFMDKSEGDVSIVEKSDGSKGFEIRMLFKK